MDDRCGRRGFLRRGTSGLLALTAPPWLAGSNPAGPRPPAGPPLQAVADATTGLPLLRLPPGFRYRSFGWTGDAMGDGRVTPDRHDGMGIVRAEGSRLYLARNHECLGDGGAFGPRDCAWDVAATGGTTQLVFDTREETLVESWASLSGTLINCSGGTTPWGTWLSCEECVIDPGEAHPAGRRSLQRLQREHGYVFEVAAEGVTSAAPLPALGRFVHEAAAVERASGAVYLTEDNRPSGFYRMLPTKPGRLAVGGELQMLRVAGRTRLFEGIDVGARLAADWVTIEEPTRAHADPRRRDRLGVLDQGRRQGAALFSRLEGCVAQRGQVLFVSTDGGSARHGQLWCYNDVQQELELLYESPGPGVLNRPDNLEVHPGGGMVLCEDGRGSVMHLRFLRDDGSNAVLAANNVQLAGERNGIAGDFRASEWAGACFSPDGRWLFVNIQTPGITLAITGDWDALREGALDA